MGRRAIKPQAVDFILKEKSINRLHRSGRVPGSGQASSSRLLNPAHPSLLPCFQTVRLFHHISLLLPLPKAKKKKQGKRKENRKKKKKKKRLSDSQYFDTRENRGGAQGKKRLENVLNSLLASGAVFLHITRFAPEPENLLYPMATSKMGWIIRILGGGNSVYVKGTYSKGGRTENTAMEK